MQFECGVEPKFECAECLKKFRHKHHLKEHMKSVHSITEFIK